MKNGQSRVRGNIEHNAQKKTNKKQKIQKTKIRLTLTAPKAVRVNPSAREG